MNVEEVVFRLVESINHADVDRMAALMADDHVFVDSDDSKVIGRVAMLDGWSRYFSMMSNYRVVVQESFSSGNIVVLVGMATGMFTSNSPSHPASNWAVPAAWRAVVEGERVAVWQVFVNPEPILAAMRNHAGGAA